MPMLLEDLAAESSASNRRAADRFDAEARELDTRQRAPAALEEIRSVAIESARLANDFAISRAHQAEGFMRSALAGLREEPAGKNAERLLHALLDSFQTSQRLVQAVRSLWRTAESVGVTPERRDELDQTERRLEELATEVQAALYHREEGWQPTDPDRLAAGLKLARAGKTVPVDEVRVWFRQSPG